MDQSESFLNHIPSIDEQRQIVDICNKFKKNVTENASDKKQIMRDCYAYSKSKFVGDDLLPLPSTKGNENDSKSNRPQVFIPVTRQNVKNLYSQIKLTLFPNDDDYFRIRAKSEQGVMFEDDLTEALKYKFKEAKISEKLGQYILNLIVYGSAAACPMIKDTVIWEWVHLPAQTDPYTGEEITPASYQMQEIDQPPLPDLDILNTINFYVDPISKDPNDGKWGYFDKKTVQEIMDSALYFNKDLVELYSSESVDTVKNDEDNIPSLTGVTDLNTNFTDIEPYIDYDLYYFPYLKTDTEVYRNIIVGVAANTNLVRFHPNLYPRGMNPAVFCDFMPDLVSPYGIGIVEDTRELQKLINILYNHVIESAARNGNRFIISENTDIRNLFGVAGGIVTTPDPSRDVISLPGNYQEVIALQNLIGVAKAEAQITAGTQNPFQGSSNVDFKKTATELQILQENSISVAREIIEHIGIMGVVPILERLMYLCADLYQEPVMIRKDDPLNGPQYITVDLSLLKSGEFIIEMSGINPSQSKQAQTESLVELMELIVSNTEMLPVIEPIINKLGELQGIKNIGALIEEVKLRMSIMQEQMMMQQQAMLASMPPQETKNVNK